MQGKLIDVRGLQQVDRALRQVDPDLRRQMYKEIGGMVKKRVTAAKDATPRRSGTAQKLTLLTKAGSKKSQALGGGSRKQGLFGFQAVSGAPYASILGLAAGGRPNLLATLQSRYGPAPRFLAREFLPSGEGGTQLWRESRAIVEKYVRELNAQIESGATSRVAG